MSSPHESGLLARHLFAPAAIIVTVLALAGCGGETPASVVLENSIKSTIDKEYDHLPVASVACSPKVETVSYSAGIVHLVCVVRFEDGRSYSTPASIEARSFQVSGYHFTWNDPPAADTAGSTALPEPTVSLPATSKQSLFYEANLARVVKALEARFASNELILSLAIYPGELEAVIGADGEAQTVTSTPSGALVVGPPVSFSKKLSGIEISQLEPVVPEQLAAVIARRGGMSAKRLRSFTLVFLKGGLAGWKIATATAGTHFQARLTGDDLEQVTSHGTRSLG